MECDTDSFLHAAVVMNRDLCPPNLETLIVRRHFYVAENFFDYLPDVGIYTVLPSLNTLELKQSAAALNVLSTSEYICQPDRLRSRHAYAYKLFKCNLNFKVSIELGRGSSLIPPYLHGEPVPEVRCLYDASRIGFQRHINKEPIVYNDPEHGEMHVLTLSHPSGRESPNARLLKSVPCPPEDDKPLSAAADADADADVPETDQLSDADVQTIMGETRRALDQMKERFARGWRLERSPLDADLDVWGEGDDDFESTDEDGTDSDFEAMIADLQNDGDEEAFLQFLEHMQEQGIEIGMESDEEGEGEEDGEWHDAQENGEEEVNTDWEDAEDELEEHEADLD
jgi:hypothetical protein